MSDSELIQQPGEFPAQRTDLLLRGPVGLSGIPRHLLENALRAPGAIAARLGPLGKGGVWLGRKSLFVAESDHAD